MFISQPTRVTVREAATAAGVTDRTIRRWIAAGALDAEGSERRRTVDLARVLALRNASHGLQAAVAQDELARLRGRYDELTERVRELEQALAEVQRANGELQARIRQAA